MRTRCLTIIAILLSAALAGCAAGGKFGPAVELKPDIGAPPAYAVEVKVAPPRASESPIVVGDRYRLGLARANTIIRCLREDHLASRATLLGEQAAPSSCARPADAVKGRRLWRRRG